MLRILFLPFLTIPSGHHHAADGIRAEIETLNIPCQFEKVDILSYGYGNIEKLISLIYLQWIQKFPQFYSFLYYLVSVKEKKTTKRYYLYEWLFLRKMKQLIKEMKPDIIICTHSLPSYLVAQLKSVQVWNGIVINVYTDYFINQLWGREHIDYHFAPSPCMREKLIGEGVKPLQTIVTGIPIHPVFRKENKKAKVTNYTVLICGGNTGAGSIDRFLDQLAPSGLIMYKVLCGKNIKLYRSIKNRNHPYIEALRYINDKEEMNKLYDKADAVITKPGGITVTECLWKKIPIIVYEALPGQEEMNLRFLKKNKLIFHLKDWKHSQHVEKQILHMLHQNLLIQQQVNYFKNNLVQEGICATIKKIVLSKQ